MNPAMSKSHTFPALLFLALLLLLAPSVARAAELIPLRAGPITMVFDPDNVFLRYIRVGTHEVLRGINAPIRSKTWSTVRPQISDLQVENRGDRFKVTFNVRCVEADIDFRWRGALSGNAQGELEFTFDGETHSTFKRNRIGFCVLHDASAAGRPWVIETVDGGSSKGRFPELISPHQPAKNLRAIRHEVTTGIHARVEFEGDVFEMEDQRNWTDASFKTYCTPLGIPYPVEVVKGTKISQKLKISIAGDLSKAPNADAGIVLALSEKESALPLLGVQVSGEIEKLSASQLQRLAALRLNHLRVDLDLSDKSFSKNLRRAVGQAKALGVPLHIGLNLGETPAFETLLAELKTLQPPVAYWLVNGGDPAHFQKAREQLAPVLGEAKIGVTRSTNFVDLNRARPDAGTVEAVGFAINPQIHAFDNASIVETLPIHADVVRSARQFSGDRPLIIGPITLSPQLVNGVPPLGGPPAGDLPTYVDARQPSLFTAAWTLGSVKYLADAGAHSATYYETAGWNGIMDADEVVSRPSAFPSRPGEVFDVYHLLREIGEVAGGRVRQIDSSDTLGAVALALRKPGRIRVLVGNLKGESQTVTLRGLGTPVAIHLLKGGETRATPELRVSLPPYGIARIDRTSD